MISHDHSQAGLAHHPPAPHGAHGAHAHTHDKHAGHDPAVFRRRFWISLVLTIPLIVTSPTIMDWFGYEIDFRGMAWLGPVLGSLGPWLSELNPTLDWIAQHQHTLVDLFANLGVATAARTGSRDPQATGHYLRQFGPSGAETVAVHPDRLSSNRGNAYINPLSLIGPEQSKRGICKAVGKASRGETVEVAASSDSEDTEV